MILLHFQEEFLKLHIIKTTLECNAQCNHNSMSKKTILFCTRFSRCVAKFRTAPNRFEPRFWSISCCFGRCLALSLGERRCWSVGQTSNNYSTSQYNNNNTANTANNLAQNNNHTWAIHFLMMHAQSKKQKTHKKQNKTKEEKKRTKPKNKNPERNKIWPSHKNLFFICNNFWAWCQRRLRQNSKNKNKLHKMCPVIKLANLFANSKFRNWILWAIVQLIIYIYVLHKNKWFFLLLISKSHKKEEKKNGAWKWEMKVMKWEVADTKYNKIYFIYI